MQIFAILTPPRGWRITSPLDDPDPWTANPLRAGVACILRVFWTPKNLDFWDSTKTRKIGVFETPKSAKTRIGGTRMWWLPPNYLLFRYPVWPPKTGFLGFLGKPLFWGDRQTGKSGGFRECAIPGVQIRCTKWGVFLHPGNHGFFGFPENPELC
jgi:hypothetical protein